MWSCTKCGQEVEDNFEVCWNCGTARDGTEDPGFRKMEEASSELRPESSVNLSPDSATTVAEFSNDPITCLRCHCKLTFVGTKEFHEGARWGVWGRLAELLVNRERFDVYCCPRCGRVEMFIDGIGEEFRPHADVDAE